jgi:hypothetical protein
MNAITSKEIRARLNRMKNGSAPGPDGMVKTDINSNGTKEALRPFFNFIYIAQRQPTSWKENKTVLIPKPGKDPKIVEHLRPLTISSILCRMYWGILDLKLRNVTTLSTTKRFRV